MADTDIKVKIIAKDETKGAVSSVENGMSSMAKKLSVAAAASAAFAFAMNNVKKSLEFADKIDKLNRQYGLSIDFLQNLNALASDSGADLGTLSLGVKELTMNLGKLNAGDRKLNAVFSSLGIRTDGRKVEDVFVDVIDSIGKIDNEIDRMTISQELFGRGSREAMAVAVQGSEGAKAAFDRLSKSTYKLSDEDIKALDDFGDSIGRIGNAAMVSMGKLAAFFLTAKKGYSEEEIYLSKIANLEKTLARPEVQENKGGVFNVKGMQEDIAKYKAILENKKAIGDKRIADEKKAAEDSARAASEAAEAIIKDAERKAAQKQSEQEAKDAAEAAKKTSVKGDMTGPASEWAMIEEEGKRQLALQEAKFQTADAWEAANKKIVDSDKRASDERARIAKETSDKIKAQKQQEFQTTMDFVDQGINLMGTALAANKRNSQEQKNIAYTMAIAQGASSAVKAWNAGMSIPWIGAPAVAAGFVALSLATTGAQIAAISNTSFASGTRNAPGGYARVGEYGAESAYIPPGSMIRNAAQTAQTGGVESAMQNVTVNFHTQQNVVETFRTKIRAGEAAGLIQDLRGAMR